MLLKARIGTAGHLLMGPFMRRRESKSNSNERNSVAAETDFLLPAETESRGDTTAEHTAPPHFQLTLQLTRTSTKHH
ncbi:unnamed protein product [Pleuronectes platessa]|uniref:Uncharacterized protein n=1 Tax=Pleuronectes platessa TaxID=8262 RepID=A0A9N7VIR0_PLEPL|nr:unnamed protein product [Pleuronectes platessa]